MPWKQRRLRGVSNGELPVVTHYRSPFRASDDVDTASGVVRTSSDIVSVKLAELLDRSGRLKPIELIEQEEGILCEYHLSFRTF